MLLWLGVFFGLNDRRLGLLVTKIVTSQVRGQFRLGYAHYPYWSSLGSLILNTPVPITGGDFDMRDPNGDPVLRVEKIEATINIGELVRGLLRSAVSAPFGRGVFIELHFSSGHVRGVFARVRPIDVLRLYPPGVTGPKLGSEINIVSTMSGRKVRPEDEPQGPGHVRITVDGEGLTFDDVTYEMAFQGWHARLEGIHGAATLRLSTDAAETRPGLMSFVYEVSPLTAQKGELVLGTPEADGSGTFSFPLRDLDLRRFGARASQRQDLVFRGKVMARNTPMELDGRLLDTYCDTGVKLDLSFEQGGGLTELVPGKIVMGQPRGRVHFEGPLSATLPVTITNRRNPCLAEPWRTNKFSELPEERVVTIAGQVTDVEAEVATVAVHHATTRFEVKNGELHLPEVVGDALGGQVRAEPLNISFTGDMPWNARIAVLNGDPAQVGLVPKALQPYVAGKLKGGFRLSGHLGVNADPDKVQIDRIEATIERLGRHDPLPKELKLAGSFTYTPETVFWKNLHVLGDTLLLEAERGSFGPASGKLDSPRVELHGKGSPLTKVLEFFGVNGSTGETTASFRLGGRIMRPEARDGELLVKELDLYGRKFSEFGTEFALKDGELALSNLHTRGDTGKLTASGTMQLFTGEVTNRPLDPKVSLHAEVEDLSLAATAPGSQLSGALSGHADLAGTLYRPTGRVELAVPLLLAQDGHFQRVLLQADLSSSGILVRQLEAALGDGKVLSTADLRYDHGRTLDLTVDLQHLPLRELPGVKQLPFVLDGRLGGKVRVLGPTQPLAPSLEGLVTIDELTVRGRSATPAGPVLLPDSLVAPAEPDPLFGLLGMVVRTLTLRHGELKFARVGGGTRISGRLFDAFSVEGLVFLDAARPRGEIALRFGCPPAAPGTPAAADKSAAASASPLCDLAFAKLLPDLLQLGEVALLGSGELRLRFGEDARGLFEPGGAPPLPDSRGSRAATCPLLAAQPGSPEPALPVSATLRLTRALLTVHTINDDGEDQRYLAFNEGDVLLCTDGSELEVGQAYFRSQRQVGENASAPIQLTAAVARSQAAQLLPDSHASQDAGQVRLRGLFGAATTDLHIIGQLRLEVLEHLLRATFRHTHGEATVDLHITGSGTNRILRGTADLRAAHLVPYDIDTPLDIATGHLELFPDRATLRDLKLMVDGAETIADGSIEIKSWAQQQLGQIDFTLRGEISARLIQWKFARNLAEARGSLGLASLHVSGTFAEPIVEGTLTAKDLLLNLRSFHELAFSRGTVRFVRGATGSPSRIVIGKVAGETGGEPLSGVVDGDGKLAINGRIEYSGLGAFMQTQWYKALDAVRLTIKLDNVRHSSGGVYNFEASTPSLLLSGNRDEMHLIGDIEVVSGRYMQDFDLADRFLSARRVTEEEKPFWDGDEFLSALQLNLNIRTRGTFRVRNNIADLRLTTTGFTITGPLVDIAMGGVIRVDGGLFWVPGLRGEFQVKGDSKIEFAPSARWPDTPFVDVRGGTRDFDQNDQQRNIELALRGRVRELKVECLSSEGMSSADCASYLVLGDLSDTIRGGRTQITPTATGTPQTARAIEYGDPAAKLVTSQLLTNQVADPLREKLRLDTVRIQFGVSTFDLQLCKRFGLYVRMCGLAEWGILGNAAAHYRGFGELQMSDLTVGQISLERIERGFSFLEDTINRFKLQAGIRLPLRY